MGIKNVVFDFGGVLIDWNPRYLYNGIFEDKDEMENFLRNICSGEWNEQQDAGRSLQEATEVLIAEHPEHEDLIRLYYDNWEVMVKGSISENVEVLHQLNSKNSFRLFGLSNWSGETFPIAYERFPFFAKFEGIVISGDEKMKKPDKEIYDLLLDRYGIKAEESIFIDDNFDNIEVANQIGFSTIHFTNGTDLKTELQKLDLL